VSGSKRPHLTQLPLTWYNRLAMASWGRRVLNEPAAAGPSLGHDVAEDLLLGWRRAVGAATGAGGAVDYARLAASPETAAATARARDLARVDPIALETRPLRLAFWINVYNALVLHGVLALGVRGTVHRTWNFFGRAAYRVGAGVFTLEEIEHGLLRNNATRAFPPWPVLSAKDPRLVLAVAPADPRIHFALNCGARSCPPVGAYRPAALDGQLELATRSFVNEEVTLDDRGRVACSKLFRWYGRDFGSPDALREFLLRHLDEGPVKAALRAGAPPCQAFRPYSWTLTHRFRD
jgi:Protein of unknown function, DUF547